MGDRMEDISGQPSAAPSRAEASLWAGALSHVLSYDESGCPHAANRAAELLARLAEQPEVDRDLRELCERASQRLESTDAGGKHGLRT